VNSAFVGLPNKAKSVLQALTLLGLRPSKMFLINHRHAGRDPGPSVEADQSELFLERDAPESAVRPARGWFAECRSGPGVRRALLQDYLLPVLTNDLYDGYVNFVNTRDSQPITCAISSSRFLAGITRSPGPCLARRWKLPDELVCCILYHHHGLQVLAHPQLGRTAVAAVALSGLLPDQLRQCYRGLEQLVLLEQKWPAFKLQEIAASVDAEHAEIGIGVQNDFLLVAPLQVGVGQRESQRQSSGPQALA